MQLFLNFNYRFLFLVWYCLETCVNHVANCITQKFTPLRSKFYKLFYGQFRQLLHISEPILSKQFFSKLEFLFHVLGSMVSKNICKLRHKLKNVKNLLKLTLSWQNKPWSICPSYYRPLSQTALAVIGTIAFPSGRNKGKIVSYPFIGDKFTRSLPVAPRLPTSNVWNIANCSDWAYVWWSLR